MGALEELVLRPGGELPVSGGVHLELGDSYLGGQRAGGQRAPLLGLRGGSHSQEPVCHVWVRLARPPLKISNKSGVLVPAGLLQTDPGNGLKGTFPGWREVTLPPNAAVASRGWGGASVSGRC